MSAGALNGNAINETRFPGAEDGLSLIELVGTVQVTASVPKLRLRLTAGASATPAAVTSSPTTRAKYLLAVTGAPTAAATVSAGSKTPRSATGVATLTTKIAPRLKFVLDAAASPAAVVSVQAVNKAKRSATTVAQAVPTVSEQRRIKMSGGAAPAAVAAVVALRKLVFSASTISNAAGTAARTFMRRVSATTIGRSTGTGALRLNRRAGAAVSCTADSVADSTIKRAAYPSALVLQAVMPSINAQQRITVGGATTQVVTLGSVAGVTARFRLGAPTVAQAICVSDAEDYGLLVNAPTERLMVVPASDRRMEVTL